MGDVVNLETSWHGQVEPDEVLAGAKEQLKTVVIVGIEKETDEIYFASSTGKITDIYFLLNRVSDKILRGDYG